MATITVSYSNGNLTLSDHGNTDASRSEQINWHIGQGVIAITDIVAKSTSPVSTGNFWANAPHAVGVNYMGTIGASTSGAWDYTISCNVGTVQNPVIVPLDPRIQVLAR